MTKRNKLYARLIVDYCQTIPLVDSGRGMSRYSPRDEYIGFIRSQSHKNNVYAMALRQIEG